MRASVCLSVPAYSLSQLSPSFLPENEMMCSLFPHERDARYSRRSSQSGFLYEFFLMFKICSQHSSQTGPLCSQWLCDISGYKKKIKSSQYSSQTVVVPTFPVEQAVKTPTRPVFCAVKCCVNCPDEWARV